MLFNEVPLYERPREKLLKDGASSLSNIELIAILLGTGTRQKNVLEVSKEVLYILNDLTDLKEISINELTFIDGIGTAKAITLLAAVELGKRIATYKKQDNKIHKAKDVYDFFSPIVKGLKQEHFYAMFLDIKDNVIAYKEISIGGINYTAFDSSVIFKWAFKYSSNRIVLVHNHPSGDTTPSQNDIRSTIEIIKMAEQLKIDIVDHIIVGDTYFSMRQENYLYKIF